MASSPLSAPVTPSATPSPPDADVKDTALPALLDARSYPAAQDAEGAGEIPAVSHAAPAHGTDVSMAKGKGKSKKGPLRLLDLPVDILKEIIQQVRIAHRTEEKHWRPGPNCT
jgi:hypothetical protein